MARSARETLFAFLGLGVMIGVILLMIPIFGPKPLENPIAVGILIAVGIGWAMFVCLNRYIFAAIRKKMNSTKTKKSGQSQVIMCPRCIIPVEVGSGGAICPQCGITL